MTQCKVSTHPSFTEGQYKCYACGKHCCKHCSRMRPWNCLFGDKSGFYRRRICDDCWEDQN